jgi:hypothetical protein
VCVCVCVCMLYSLRVRTPICSYTHTLIHSHTYTFIHSHTHTQEDTSQNAVVHALLEEYNVTNFTCRLSDGYVRVCVCVLCMQCV